jgi:UDP-3-O-[3-hydroxymyristoyl] glucosamine N-acyltransferase
MQCCLEQKNLLETIIGNNCTIHSGLLSVQMVLVLHQILMERTKIPQIGNVIIEDNVDMVLHDD